MTRIILLFCLCISAAFAAPRDPRITQERAARAALNLQFRKFKTFAVQSDQLLVVLRDLVKMHSYKDAEDLATEIAPRLRATAKQWAKIEDLYSAARRARLNIH